MITELYRLWIAKGVFEQNHWAQITNKWQTDIEFPIYDCYTQIKTQVCVLSVLK